ncbi:MAG: hypothetical protein ACO1SV_27650 [Fimbriimonas sp.]
MSKLVGIHNEIARRIMDAFSLSEDRVFYCPKAAELPASGSYGAYRSELVNGRYEAGAYDTSLLRVFVAAELPDPGVERVADRLAILEALRARLTPTFDDFTVFPEIPGWEIPVVTDALLDPMEDSPGMLFVGMTIEGEVTLGRGGYEG